MRRLAAIAFLLVASLLLASFASGQVKPSPAPVPRPAAAASSDRLPVKKVVLYKNGVGYFEHTGRVQGTQQISIDFTTAQLDDVIKSLTVIDLNKGRVSGIRYNSIAPLEERLRTLRLSLGEHTNQMGFLQALRGARLEVRNGTLSATGKLLSVESRPRIKNDQRVEVTEISLVTDTGDVRTFEVTPTTSIRITDGDLREEVSRYLGLIGSARERDVRRMTISAEGEGDRGLFVSYISEVPVWKSTYRIVLPNDPKAKALLQGWAIVDNTVGEDWKNIELSLVAGAPQSFVQHISQPQYVRRPVVALPQTAQMTPQAHESTMNVAPPPAPAVIAPDRVTNLPINERSYKSFELAKTARNAAGAAAEAVEVTASDATAEATNEMLLEGSDSAAEGQEIGDLFEYKLKQRVTIGKNQSALVPIVHAQIDADRVSLWNESRGRTLRAIWVNNTSGLSLDAGTFNVLDHDTFAGEGLLQIIRPGEKRLLSYAVDQSVKVDSESDSENEKVTRVRILNGVMTTTYGTRDARTYTIRNNDDDARSVVIEHPARDGWKIVSTAKPEESTSSFHRFRVAVEPHQTAELAVAEYMPQSATYHLNNLNDETIALFLKQKSIDGAIEEALRKVVAQKNKVNAFDAQIRQRQKEIADISTDQNRLRENMKALKGSAEEKALLQRYATQLNAQEDRLEAVRKEIVSLEAERDIARRELARIIEAISMEATL